jgi:hypothetical protein
MMGESGQPCLTPRRMGMEHVGERVGWTKTERSRLEMMLRSQGGKPCSARLKEI